MMTWSTRPLRPSPPSAPVAPASARRSRGRDLAAVGRRLWQAVILAAVLNVILVVALLMTRGEIPGIWHAGESIRPGASVRIAGAGLVARAAPDTESAIVADLPDGGSVRISGEPVQGDDGLWWPVEVETATGAVERLCPGVVGAGAVTTGRMASAGIGTGPGWSGLGLVGLPARARLRPRQAHRQAGALAAVARWPSAARRPGACRPLRHPCRGRRSAAPERCA